MKLTAFLCLLSSLCLAQLGPGGATASFKDSLPPKPTADLSAEQQAGVEKRLAEVTKAFQAVKKHPHAADADIFLKAVRFAIDFHEWYDKKAEDAVKKANALLDEAKNRIDALAKNETPWMNGTGQKVLGFYSQIDDSPQPYGVEIPESLEFGKGKPSVPMWIWLHGRGDTSNDLAFVYSRLTAKKPGQFQPKGSIVIHPFGRYCNGWKSAGETDVFEARNDAIARFNVDWNRIALAGFSMGGAGAWHFGAHFADQFACVHTGAGFADVKNYTKLAPENYPSWYEQKLWGVYDVPEYVRNFGNVSFISYSGEVDPQRATGEYMQQVLKSAGLSVPYLIGPGMPHKYHPDSLKEIQAFIEKAVAKGRNPLPKKVVLQTRTLAYNQMFWLTLHAMDEQWADARVEAIWNPAAGSVSVNTKNAAALSVTLPKGVKTLEIDGQDTGAEVHEVGDNVVLAARKKDGKWTNGATLDASQAKPKRPGQQGPIDDNFKRRFVVVLPEGKSSNPKVDAWVAAESAHFISRWRGLMRGDPIVRKASEVTDRDAEDSNLILWGTPESNAFIAKAMSAKAMKAVLTWDAKTVKIGTQSFAADTHVPLLCQPNPMSPHHSIVINSGLTFREAHDKTNSLQNPKLPDWAILDITQPPNSEVAGKVVAADFFDENWQVIPRVKSPTAKE